MLVENTIFGIRDKVQISIERIKFAYDCAQQRGLGALYVCFSGGKDSTVLAELCRLAKEQYGVEYELHYNVTGIDPPELVYFMRENYPELHWEKYKKSMWQLIKEKYGPPTRLMRYCCAELKERGGEGRMCLTGVRHAESARRKNTRTEFEVMANKPKDKILFNDNDDGRLGFENCTLKRKLITNPIVDWENEDVWEFIHQQKLPYCKLYDEGFTRLGCIGCCMARPEQRRRDFSRYPKFEKAYLDAFDRALKAMPHPEKCRWKTAQDIMDWWLADIDCDKPIDGQMSIFDNSTFLQGE